jgi:hypothetical protein
LATLGVPALAVPAVAVGAKLKPSKVTTAQMIASAAEWRRPILLLGMLHRITKPPTPSFRRH